MILTSLSNCARTVAYVQYNSRIQFIDTILFSGQMGSISAPGQGRSGSIGNVRTALGHQPYSQHENIMVRPVCSAFDAF
jgi:hypothetical protein